MTFSVEDLIDELIPHALWNKTNRKLEQRRQAELELVVPRPIQHRRTRDHVGAAQRLFADYFAEEPQFALAVFQRDLFVHIVSALSAR